MTVITDSGFAMDSELHRQQTSSDFITVDIGKLPVVTKSLSWKGVAAALAINVPYLDSATQHLLRENVLFLNQISVNLSREKLQDNNKLFVKTSDNITSILNSMRQMPGIMSQMPSLPNSINEDRLDSIMRITSLEKLMVNTLQMNMFVPTPCAFMMRFFKANDS